jgi:hypothetical protein
MGPYPKQYFKMKEMKHDLERSGWFYSVIEKHVTAGVSCILSVSGLIKAVREFPWPSWLHNVKVLENPYYSAFKAITDKLAQHQTQLNLTEPVDFIFDNEAEKDQCIGMWDELRQNSREDIRLFMGDTPIYRDDKTTLPLQAADLYAYWVREWNLNGIRDGVEKLKFPWPVERDVPRLHMTFGESDFIEEFKKVFDPAVQKRMGMDPNVKQRTGAGPENFTVGVGTLVNASSWTGESRFLRAFGEPKK